MEQESAGKKIGALRPFVPFTVLFFVMLLFHATLWEHPDLDTIRYFAKALDDGSMASFLSMRYQLWSSRILIECVLVLLSRTLILWKLLDSLLFVLLAVSFVYLLTGTVKDIRMNWFTAGAMLIYPFGDMQSAGWTATTLNYFWPLAFGVFSCTAVASIVHQRKETTWWHWVLCITAGIFACNMEQMCGVLLFVYVTCFCYCLWRDKKLYVGLLLQLLSAVASTIFILKCPGNWVRMQDEVAVSGIQGFEGMNPVEKMLYGWNDTCAKALNERIVFAVTVTVLFILTLLRTKSLVKRLIALFPVIMVFYRCVLSDFFPPVSLLLVEHPTMSRFTIGSRAAWGMLFLWMLMLGCNAVTVTFLCDSKAEKIFLVLLLLTGLFSRVIVGQSGSLENSSSRTFLYFDFTLLFLMLFGIRKTAVEGERLQNGLRLAYAGTALFCMINTFVFAARLIA